MIAYVNNGLYRGQTISGEFNVLHEPRRPKSEKLGKNWFVKVEIEPGKNGRIYLDDLDQLGEPKPPAPTKTDEQRMDEIAESFQILDDVVSEVVSGRMKGLIIAGPPGVGKSYTTIEQIENKNAYNMMLDGSEPAKRISGFSRPLDLYQKMYDYRHKGNVLILDDLDSIFDHNDALNLLKAALDTTGKRMIAWGSETNVLDRNEIPKEFEFEGSIIFITNKDLETETSPKLKPHVDALLNRCLYMNIDLNTDEDLMLRIRQIVRDGMLNSYEFSDSQVEELLNWIDENKSKMLKMSLRTVKLLADLASIHPEKWKLYATRTFFKKSARVM